MKFPQLIPTLFLIPFLFLAEASAHGLPETINTCGKFEFARSGDRPESKGRYCITTTKDSKNTNVLYFFHGRKQNEKAWMEAKWPAKLREAWGNDAPTVITISYGGNWLLVEKNSKKRSGLYNVVSEKVIPLMEEKVQVLAPQANGERMLLGESMGGFNAAQLYTRTPSFFTKAALVCPAITAISPFDGLKASWEYKKRTGASIVKIVIGHMVARMFISDEEAWQKNAPLTLAERIDSSFPPLFVSCGSEDSYGFFEGAGKFADIASGKGANVTWEPVRGSHCSFNPASVVKFFESENLPLAQSQLGNVQSTR